MKKRIGYGAGLLLTAVGVGIPAVVLAADTNSAPTAWEAGEAIEAARPAIVSGQNDDWNATGVDPFGGVVEPSRSWSDAAAFEEADALPDANRDGSYGSASRAIPDYGIGLAEPAAYGVDEFGGYSEPTSRVTASAATTATGAAPETASTHGLTRVEPSALGVDPTGGMTSDRPRATAVNELDIYGPGFDPYWGIE